MLLYTGKYVFDLNPCVDWEDLFAAEKTLYDYCFVRLRQLDYYPRTPSPSCTEASSIIVKFLARSRVTNLFHKAGSIERDLSSSLNLTPAYRYIPMVTDIYL